jgi:hypothetical protein
MYIYKVDKTGTYLYRYGAIRCQYWYLQREWVNSAASDHDVTVPDTLVRLLGAQL